MYPICASADGQPLTGTPVTSTIIKSGTNGSFRSNQVISFKYQVLRMQLKLLLYKGFCGTKPSRLDDFLVRGVLVKHFLRLFSLRGMCKVLFFYILVMLVLVSGVFFFAYFTPSQGRVR